MLPLLVSLSFCYTILGSAYDDYAVLEPGWIIVTFQQHADVFCRADKITAVVPYGAVVHINFYSRKYSYRTTGRIVVESRLWGWTTIRAPAVVFIETDDKVLISPISVSIKP